ncbi:MAG TPA: maleylpyruvate isomerase family mycothiol-dependent enzyme, partial [Streptosporangiaceae bacterium]|nr:maleylpyruvate isomerase family mycothiol-dependent enzyme [Streptosporangiaceae bacterium]
MEIWPVIHDQRKALAADLKGRNGEDWSTASLCDEWTVRDVLAHMTSAASLTPPAFFAKMIGSGFSFDKVQASGVAANRGSSPADTMARFEAVLTSVKHPPGPADTWLGETIVHAEDIRRPLGIV